MASSAFFLVGPTASGKSAVAQYLAETLGAGILSADSMLVYRGLDIGTAKPTLAERGEVPYWGIDLADPDSAFSVYDYLDAVGEAGADPTRPLIVAGGTGLYIKGLVMGLDRQGSPAPEERKHWEALYAREGVAGLQEALRRADAAALEALADPENPRRLIRALERVGSCSPALPRAWCCYQQDTPVIGLRVAPERLSTRIVSRVEAMYAQGLLDEVRGLLAAGKGLAGTASQAIGYAEAIDTIEGRCTVPEAKARTMTRTRRLARKQRTWFRHQLETVWVDVGDADDVATVARRVREEWERYGPTRIRWK